MDESANASDRQRILMNSMATDARQSPSIDSLNKRHLTRQASERKEMGEYDCAGEEMYFY